MSRSSTRSSVSLRHLSAASIMFRLAYNIKLLHTKHAILPPPPPPPPAVTFASVVSSYIVSSSIVTAPVVTATSLATSAAADVTTAVYSQSEVDTWVYRPPQAT